jgi:uncharacterized protein YacL
LFLLNYNINIKKNENFIRLLKEKREEKEEEEEEEGKLR